MDVIYRLQDMEFEWDEQKAQTDLRKHGVAFEEAAEAFLDPFLQYGDASTGHEQRDLVLGYSLSQRVLLVVHVQRGVVIRIIPARVATRRERRAYEEA